MAGRPHEGSGTRPRIGRVAAARYREGVELLCHRSAARRWYPDVWDFPGGHVDGDESPRSALVHEVHEVHEELAVGLSDVELPPCRTLCIAAQDAAELVAFWVCQDHPARAVGATKVGELAGAETEYAFDLSISCCVGGRKVQVKAMLDRLGMGDLDEQQAMPRLRVEDHAFLMTGFVGVAGRIGVADHVLHHSDSAQASRQSMIQTLATGDSRAVAGGRRSSAGLDLGHRPERPAVGDVGGQLEALPTDSPGHFPTRNTAVHKGFSSSKTVGRRA